MGLFSFARRSRKPVLVHVFAKTDAGRTREHNEDCFLVADLTRGESSLQPEVREHALGELGSLFVVADGMGGAVGGEIASALAVDTVFQHLSTAWRADAPPTPERFAFRLREAVERANDAIHRYSAEHPEFRGMGSTCTAVGLLDGRLYVTQVGDSRAYLVRGGHVVQLTRDQSLTQRLVDAGELTEEEAARSERRNIILQALGPEATVKVELTHQQVRRGDVLVVCSDGLSGQVSNEEITEVVSGSTDLVGACDELVRRANENGGPDNITVIVARLDGEGLQAPRRDDSIRHRLYRLSDGEYPDEGVSEGSRRESPGETVGGRRLLLGALVALALLAAVLLLSGASR